MANWMNRSARTRVAVLTVRTAAMASLAVAGLAGRQAAASPITVYTQNFDISNSSGASSIQLQSIGNTTGWDVHFSPSGSVDGSSAAVLNSSAGDPHSGTTYGFLGDTSGNAGNSEVSLLWTDFSKYTTSNASYNASYGANSLTSTAVSTVSWVQGLNHKTDASFLAVRLTGGQWYVATTGETQANDPVSGGTFSTQANTVSANFSSLVWDKFTFNGGLTSNSSVGMSVATGAGNTNLTLPSAQITAIGLYIPGGTDVTQQPGESANGYGRRIDTFAISENVLMPEPAAAALLLLALPLALRRRKGAGVARR